MNIAVSRSQQNAHHDRFHEPRAPRTPTTVLPPTTHTSPARDPEPQLLSSLLAREGSGPAPDMVALERAFVKVARSYSTRKGISYAAWRALGVPASVLAKAKVARTRS